MTYRTWEELSEVEQLQSHYSDLHKDTYGFRPRYDSSENWNSAEYLRKRIDAMNAENERHITELSKTFAGREQLREEGWGAPPETDPVLIQHARWLKEERERRYREWW